MTDEIRLTGLTIRGFHGVFDFEKRDGQDFVVDVILRGDLSLPAATDDLADTIDYGTLADDLAAIVAGEPYDLIEALAGALADRCLEFCAEVEVTVRKPQAPIAHAFTDVAVTVRRTRARSQAEPQAPTQAQTRTLAAPSRAVIALGANLGDALATLQDAAHALDLHPRIAVVAGSPVYVTVPVGGIDQPDFQNAAVIVDTTLPPHELLAVCQGIEAGAGRTREVRWGPRTLDLDIVHLRSIPEPGAEQGNDPSAAEVRLVDPVLTLPHPRAGERAFVLAPWADLQADAFVDTPRGPEPLTTALAHADDADGVQRTGAIVWTAEQNGQAEQSEHGDPTSASEGGGG